MQLGIVCSDKSLLLKILRCAFNYGVFGEWRTFASLLLQTPGREFTLDVAFLSQQSRDQFPSLQQQQQNLLTVKIQLFTMSWRRQSNNKEQNTNRRKCGNFHQRDRFPWPAGTWFVSGWINTLKALGLHAWGAGIAPFSPSSPHWTWYVFNFKGPPGPGLWHRDWNEMFWSERSRGDGRDGDKARGLLPSPRLSPLRCDGRRQLINSRRK